MNKIILSFLCFYLFFNLHIAAQNLVEVSYIHSTKIEGTPTEIIVVATLLANSQNSIYEMDYVGETGFIGEIKGKKGGSINLRSSKNPKIFKDLNPKTIFSIGLADRDPYIVKDSIGMFIWESTHEFKEILGYKCQRATLSFRGRDYVAFYTNELSIQNGPWKFSGLPGLILEIKSTDDFFKIEAFELNLFNVESVIEYPFNTSIEDAIMWQEFVEIYKKKSENPYIEVDGRKINYSLPKRKIEVIMKD